MKKTSCGIVIINENNQILMGHVTGNSFFDIPKGLMSEDCEETPIETAIRECGEETSLVFTINDLIDIGKVKYNSAKDLYLFKIFVKNSEIKLDSLKCNSFFEHYITKKTLPEVDGFQWINISEESFKNNCAKSMANVLTQLMNDKVFEKEKLSSLKKNKV